jgi:hypothetical protein
MPPRSIIAFSIVRRVRQCRDRASRPTAYATPLLSRPCSARKRGWRSSKARRVALRLEKGCIAGIQLADGSTIAAGAVILASGTFLGGRIFRGEERETGGRVGERAATALGVQLRDCGLPIARLKTGTPPRLDGRTIDWAALEEQPSDADDWRMSPMTAGPRLPQLACAITRTNFDTHDIIRSGPRPLAPVQRGDRSRRTTLLPVDRGQDLPLRRP